MLFVIINLKISIYRYLQFLNGKYINIRSINDFLKDFIVIRRDRAAAIDSLSVI